MRVLCALFALMFLGGVVGVPGPSAAQTAPAPTSTSPQAIGTLKQVMKGILLPTSDQIFAVQNEAPKTAEGWETIENDAIAIAEAARSLIAVRGRMCSSGLPVPAERPDFIKFAQLLVEAANVTYKAAQAKNQELVSDSTSGLSDACENCHIVYREIPVRCTVK